MGELQESREILIKIEKRSLYRDVGAVSCKGRFPKTWSMDMEQDLKKLMSNDSAEQVVIVEKSINKGDVGKNPAVPFFDKHLRLKEVSSRKLEEEEEKTLYVPCRSDSSEVNGEARNAFNQWRQKVE